MIIISQVISEITGPTGSLNCVPAPFLSYEQSQPVFALTSSLSVSASVEIRSKGSATHSI
jgi:hypothetical protein